MSADPAGAAPTSPSSASTETSVLAMWRLQRQRLLTDGPPHWYGHKVYATYDALLQALCEADADLLAVCVALQNPDANDVDRAAARSAAPEFRRNFEKTLVRARTAFRASRRAKALRSAATAAQIVRYALVCCKHIVVMFLVALVPTAALAAAAWLVFRMATEHPNLETAAQTIAVVIVLLGIPPACFPIVSRVHAWARRDREVPRYVLENAWTAHRHDADRFRDSRSQLGFLRWWHGARAEVFQTLEASPKEPSWYARHVEVLKKTAIRHSYAWHKGIAEIP